MRGALARTTTATFTAMKATDASDGQPRARPPACLPASARPPGAEPRGAANASRALTATARSMRDDGAHEAADHEEGMGQHGPTRPGAVDRHRQRDAGAQQAADDARHQQGGDAQHECQARGQRERRRRGVRSRAHGAPRLPAHEAPWRARSSGRASRPAPRPGRRGSAVCGGNDAVELGLDVADDDIGHRAGRRGHRHHDVHPVIASTVDAVDQADVDDGHRDLGVDDLAQARPRWAAAAPRGPAYGNGGSRAERRRLVVAIARQAALNHQDPGQGLPVARDVGERVAVEHGVERLDGLAKHALQPAGAGDDAALAVVGEAFRRHRRAFGVAHDLADADLRRRHRQLDAPALAAHGVEPALLAEEVHDLDQVVLGDVERPGDLGDGRPPRRVGRKVDQHAQAVVGEGGEFHGRQRPAGDRPPAGQRAASGRRGAVAPAAGRRSSFSA